jgi:hypothetical protein
LVWGGKNQPEAPASFYFWKGKQLFHALFERRKLFLDNLPEFFRVNTKIVVGNYITQSFDLFPINIGMRAWRSLGIYRLSQNLVSDIGLQIFFGRYINIAIEMLSEKFPEPLLDSMNIRSALLKRDQ